VPEYEREYKRLKVTIELEFSIDGAEYPDAVRQVTDKVRALDGAKILCVAVRRS